MLFDKVLYKCIYSIILVIKKYIKKMFRRKYGKSLVINRLGEDNLDIVLERN